MDDVEQVNADYRRLQLTTQTGVKPVDLKIRPRAQQQQQQQREQDNKGSVDSSINKAVSVFFGGNIGTSESLVQALTRSAPIFGLDLINIQGLDTVTKNKTLPAAKPPVIIIPSYGGRPPDNAKKFVAWIEQMASQAEKLPPGTKFAVFGVGNSDWTHTFHKVPRMVDDTLAKIGAERIMDAGFANVKRDLVGPWEAWSEQLCMTLSGTTEKNEKANITDRLGLDVRIEKNNLSALPQALGGEHMYTGIVVVNRELADTSVGAAKCHVEVRLPAGTEYKAGDYLVVQARNPDATVSRTMRRFSLSAEDVMSVLSSNKDFIPTHPIAIEHFLRSSVELAQPITLRQLATLATYSPPGSPEHIRLEEMQTAYQALLDARYSILDVLEEVPLLSLPFGVYIDLLLPLNPRLYSIATSPLASPQIVGLTFDLLSSPSLSGHGTFSGVASSHLFTRLLGSPLSCAVRATKLPFRLPASPLTPIIMLAAGSGIAPMRAFCQERAAIFQNGGKLGPAVLYFGCRHPERDLLYREELEAWEAMGVVQVVGCFSRPDGMSDGKKGRWVPDAVWEDRVRVWELWGQGGVMRRVRREGSWRRRSGWKGRRGMGGL
ncbi:MAG: hypothetical protein Q9197_001126 [Variospora fuerteventurae]